MFEGLPHLSCSEENTIFQLKLEHQTVKVCENDTYRWLSMGGEYIQSIINLSDPSQVLLPYAQSMLLALTFTRKPRSILNLGSGCGTFERFFIKNYPEMSITSVELNTDIIEISKQFFYIPSEHPVINKSAEEFIESNKNKYDIIFCDLHDGTQHPDFIYQVEFYNKIFNSLSENGTFVINLFPGHEKQFLNYLLSARKVFRWQHLLEFDNYDNVLVYMHKQEPNICSSDVIVKELRNRMSIDLTPTIGRLTLLPVSVT